MRDFVYLKAAMTTSGTFSFGAPGDAARAAELRRVKVLATLVLTGTLALFVTAKMLLPVHPVFGFVAAFAEAATIGGLADWYAVVALFRRPLGLPIPHTAIIQSNQHRIADKLGEFIEVHESMLPPGQMPHPPHKHPNTEMLFIQNGTLEYLDAGKPVPTGPGDIVFSASNIMHGLKNVGTTDANYIVVSVGKMLKE